MGGSEETIIEGPNMYEKFTDRARKIMQLADQESCRMNHEYIGTEHLLLGLIKEGSGVAANVLKNMGVDLNKARTEVLKLVQVGPDMVTMGKLPQTPRTKRVIEHAIESAKSLNHNYVGTEHLLLGLVKESEGVAADVLKACGATAAAIEEEILNLLGHAGSLPTNIGKAETQWIVEQIKLIVGKDLDPATTLKEVKKLL